jgi:tetratricopeptide (TPR) repeat protein
MLDSLDRVISRITEFQHARESRIEQYKYLLRRGELTEQQRYDIQSIVALEYRAFICDSIIHYHNLNIDLARKMNDPALENRSHLQLATTLAVSGMYIDAWGELEMVDRRAVRTDAEKEEYYNAGYNLYRELIDNTRNPRARARYAELSACYEDSLRRVVSPSSDLFWGLEQRKEQRRKNYDEALRINDRWLENTSPSDPMYATILFRRAMLYSAAGNPEEYLNCLIRSAMVDVRTATKDNASLLLVARVLFEKGDIERANRYTRVSMADARFYNARLRGVQMVATVPAIIEAYNTGIDSHLSHMRTALIVISLLLLLILVLSMRAVRQNVKLRRSQKALKLSHETLEARTDQLDRANAELGAANRKLVEANYVKENYIAQYLGLTSSYIDKLEGLRRVINKKIREGKNAEVLDMTRPTMQAAEREVSDFYARFDAGFLAIFPTFIEEFNELLLPGERIFPESRNGKPTLSTELRVFALIRLGFQDSSSIAQMLRYSVNTIYNVRAQVKNKAAVDRSDFEARVKQIGAFA